MVNKKIKSSSLEKKILMGVICVEALLLGAGKCMPEYKDNLNTALQVIAAGTILYCTGRVTGLLINSKRY